MAKKHRELGRNASGFEDSFLTTRPNKDMLDFKEQCLPVCGKPNADYDFTDFGEVMKTFSALQIKYREQVEKAIKHLQYSANKTQTLPMRETEMTEEDLEAWEGFSSRFARVVDLYTTKYLRACILNEDPGFEGTYRDLLDRAEKEGWIENADLFMKLRELRNIHSHDYRDEQLARFLTDLRDYAPHLLKIKL